jgi:hypothetical protein
MRIEIDYKIGQPVYIRHDPEQVEYRLNRIIIEQKGLLSLEILGADGEAFEIYEIHCSKERDVLRTMKNYED